MLIVFFDLDFESTIFL